ncbi:MAG: bile acid:sodium symporter family protein [Actinomycetaceae bacterium]|nr:bile acid:sodium symporter family protein [Actinomycetaceae bacterium]
MATFDPFILGIIAVLVLGIVLRFPQHLVDTFSALADGAVVILFFFYGSKLRTKEVISGFTNWKLQLAILFSTFIAFPILGLIGDNFWPIILGPTFAMGALYLTLLPSTVQSSIAFVSTAKGNVPAAVCAATASNVFGMFLTPFLVMVLMGKASGVSMNSIKQIFFQLLLPFIVGQLLQPLIGNWVRKHRPLTRIVDVGTILLVVWAAVTGATAQGLWASVTWGSFFGLLCWSGLLLAITLAMTWFGGKAIGLSYEDRIALLMCGSKKSLATGMPMAQVIFPPLIAAGVAVPLILFHQIQLFVCAIIARQLGKRNHTSRE